MHKGSTFSMSLPSFVVLNNSYPNGYEVVSIVWVCISLMITDVEIHCMYMIAAFVCSGPPFSVEDTWNPQEMPGTPQNPQGISEI